MSEEKVKRFSVLNSRSLFTKYCSSGKPLKAYLRENKLFTGKIKWFDSYAFKLSLQDGSGNIIIPIHNILYYECEHVFREGEIEKESAHRTPPDNTGQEESQLNRYWRKKTLLHFHLKNGIEIKGRLKNFQDYAYTVKPDDEDWLYRITKRHILYYKKIKT
jgi:sRNA-binding regulator protein Hfq